MGDYNPALSPTVDRALKLHLDGKRATVPSGSGNLPTSFRTKHIRHLRRIGTDKTPFSPANVRIADHAGSDLGTAVPCDPSAADYGERSIL
jgi:hypothetical protein